MSKLFIVGIGPGAYEQMTIRAVRVLEECEVVIGYHVYTDLVKEHFPGKEYITTPMKKEIERCRIAFEEAGKGKKAAVICSGDAGIYGMAGLMYELGKMHPDIELEVVPGVTAAVGGAAVLGAPLGHDFCLISLSDLLTPWDKIEQRLAQAAKADFIICLYNPSSRKRQGYLKRACDIILQYQKENLVCGVVKNIARQGQVAETFTLKQLSEKEADMFTTVFIGNTETQLINGNMITPRGYRHEG